MQKLLSLAFIVAAVVLLLLVCSHTNFLASTFSSATNQHPVTVVWPGSKVAHAAPTGSCFDIAKSAATAYGIDPTLYARQINQESGCKDVTSPAGAQGYAQLMPAMSASLHVDPHNMTQSLGAGARLMAGYLKSHDGSWPIALACYNAGTNVTAQALAYGANWQAHLPAETQRYIAAIV